MNYLRHYCNLIRKAENRIPPKGYTEKHHVFPISIYGKNDRIVVLTAREHYIAHCFLERICIKRYGLNNQKTIKMSYASWSMNNQKRNKDNLYKNSILYEKSRIRYINSYKESGFYSRNGKKGIETHKKLGIGYVGMTFEKRSRNGKKGGKTNKENKTGIFSMTTEDLSTAGKKGGKIGGIKGAKKQHKQKWKCLVTGFVSTPCGLSSYQKARGIDKSMRVRVE